MSLQNYKTIISNTYKKISDEVKVLGGFSERLTSLTTLVSLVNFYEKLIALKELNPTVDYDLTEQLKTLKNKIEYLIDSCPELCSTVPLNVYRNPSKNTPPTIQDNVIELDYTDQHQLLNFSEVVFNYADAENNPLSNVVITALDSNTDLLINNIPAVVNIIHGPSLSFEGNYEHPVYETFIKNTGWTTDCTATFIQIEKAILAQIPSNYVIKELHNDNNETIFTDSNGTNSTEVAVPSIDVGQQLSTTFKIKVKDSHPYTPFWSNEATITLLFNAVCEETPCDGPEGTSQVFQINHHENYVFDVTDLGYTNQGGIGALLITELNGGLSGTDPFNGTLTLNGVVIQQADLPVYVTAQQIPTLVYTPDTTNQGETIDRIVYNSQLVGSANYCNGENSTRIIKNENTNTGAIVQTTDLNHTLDNEGDTWDTVVPTNITYGGTGGYTILWEKISGPEGGTILDNSVKDVELKNLVAGTYQFQITVTTDVDNFQTTDIATITIGVRVNTPPTVEAGANANVQLPVSSWTKTDATGSDSDGYIQTILWTQVSGPNISTISNGNTFTPSFSNLVAGVYQFQITVTDNDGATATDTFTLTVAASKIAPTVYAGVDEEITLPTDSKQITTATATDPDGTIDLIVWQQLSGPNTAGISNGTTLTPTFTGLVVGTYIFRITVTDNDSITAIDDMQILVRAALVPPVVDAGTDQILGVGVFNTQLSATDSDSDGVVVSRLWSQVSGPNTATFSDDTVLDPTITGLVSGTYIFEILVTDNDGLTSTDQVSVLARAENSAPIVTGPTETEITGKTSILLEGYNATDIDGTIVSISWTQESGPNVATIFNGNTYAPNISGLIVGVYQFRITVVDNDGGVGSLVLTLTVS